MFLIDVGAPLSARGPLATKVKQVRFDIPDRFDPMMPITRIRDDLRFLSLETTPDEVGVRMFDFSKENPGPEKVSLLMDGKEVTLHPSWGLRPVLVLETREGGLKTKLVFSRAEISPQPDDAPPLANTESMKLEALVFERGGIGPGGTQFVKASGVACTVTYKFDSIPEFPCYRPFDPTRPMRASPAARMQASQILVGRFAGREGYSLAFPDFCLKAEPVMILKPQGSTFVQTSAEAGWDDIKRKVSCEPLESSEHVSKPITPAPEVKMTGWPLP
jgi:hypothetical protein